MRALLKRIRIDMDEEELIKSLILGVAAGGLFGLGSGAFAALTAGLIVIGLGFGLLSGLIAGLIVGLAAFVAVLLFAVSCALLSPLVTGIHLNH